MKERGSGGGGKKIRKWQTKAGELRAESSHQGRGEFPGVKGKGKRQEVRKKGKKKKG